MNKNAIWSIVGLISVAVIGLLWLQANMIQTSITVNEKVFNDKVFSALQALTEHLESEEELESFNYQNGYVSSLIHSNTTVNTASTKIDHYPQKGLDHQIPTSFREDIKATIIHQKWATISGQSQQNLLDRIEFSRFTNFLQKQLENRGIHTPFHYGIYANDSNDIIVIDDKKTTQADGNISKLLLASNYKTSLFPKDVKSPGLLLIQFPEKERVLWSSLWKNVLGTVLFTLIILGCFAYTVQVILRQKKVSEMKTDFINNMTHEFKTPIATISLAADSISSPMIAGKPDKVQRFANIIKEENKRMNSQVEKVLQMAVLDKQRNSLNREDINLHDIIYKAAENISLQVEKKQGQVNLDLKATQPIMVGDTTHISNVINNLLDNANKYSPEKPEILISSRNVARGIEVIIKDNGIGMNSEARKHIFDRFYRVHTGDLHDVKGFGLGLSYVKAMIVAHKGQIDVKSELGKGSSFILLLPTKQ